MKYINILIFIINIFIIIYLIFSYIIKQNKTTYLSNYKDGTFNKYTPRILHINYDNHLDDKEQMFNIIKKMLNKQIEYNDGTNRPLMTNMTLHYLNLNVINRFINWLLINKINEIIEYMSNPTMTVGTSHLYLHNIKILRY